MPRFIIDIFALVGFYSIGFFIIDKLCSHFDNIQSLEIRLTNCFKRIEKLENEINIKKGKK